MEKISTNFDLIRSLYNETTASENQSLKQELAQNAELNAEYAQLREAKNALPKVLFNPSESVLDRILAFSRTTAVAQQV
jgi:cell shape-determining protein MreC